MYEGIIQDLIDELGRLPGVGPKSAQRIAFHLLQADPVDVRRLADVLVEVKARADQLASQTLGPLAGGLGGGGGLPGLGG